MRTRSPFLHSVAVLVALVLLLAACGSGGGGGDAPGGGAGEAAEGENSEGGGGSGSGGEGGSEGGSGATGGDVAPSGTPTPPGGGEITGEARREDIPLAGRYRYVTTVNAVPGEEFLDVVDAGDGDGWVRQLHIRGKADTATSQAVAWLEDLFYVEAEQRTREGTLSLLCSWEPGITLLKLPVEVGAKWDADSTCADKRAAVRRRIVKAEVLRTETLTIGGAPVETFVIKWGVTTTTDSDDPPLSTREEERSTLWVSQDRHLLVRTEGTFAATLNGVPQGVERFEKALESLEPDAGEG